MTCKAAHGLTCSMHVQDHGIEP